MKHYIAAGFDPARFWDITLRLYSLEMEGAIQRIENRRGEVWFAAMLPHLKETPSLHEFMTGAKDKRADLIKCIDAWDKIDRALISSRSKDQ